MHPLQEHVNTLGIDCLMQMLTEHINEYEMNSFSTQSVTINGWQLAKMKKSIPDMSLP